MNLNAYLHTNAICATATPILLIHGLFGSLDNLAVLARGLTVFCPVLQVDVRNHGLSARSNEMNYHALAQDMLDTLDAHGIDNVSVVGHSMGGKIAMAMTALTPERIKQLVIIDIAPVNYPVRRHDDIFAAAYAVMTSGCTTRTQAKAVMRNHIYDDKVISFLLKSFQHGEWRFNVSVLRESYSTLSGWENIPAWPHPVLFIRGGLSSYLNTRYHQPVINQFPQARMHVVAGADHWVHAEKPDAVLRTIQRFFSL